MNLLFERFLRDELGSIKVSLLAFMFIFVTVIVWVATFTPVFMAIDRLFTVVDVPVGASVHIAQTLRLCNIAAGLSLLCEVIAYLVWAVASAFKREDQTFAGGFI